MVRNSSRSPKFLSTSPARGTTDDAIYCPYCGKISIHVPREGDDSRAQVHAINA